MTTQTRGRQALRELALDLQARYVATLDDRRIRDWPDLFTEDACYSVVPRSNRDAGRPLSILLDDSKARIRDRVTYVEEIWTGNFTDYIPRHLYTVLSIEPSAETPAELIMRTNLAVYFTEPDGRTMLFAAGEYEDIVVVEDQGVHFRQKTVVLDTDLLPRYFVYPL